MTIRQVCCSLGCVGAVLLASCALPPRWVVVAGDDEGRVIRFDVDLQQADTLRLALPDDLSNTITRVAVTQGGAGILVRLFESGRVDAIERLRLTTADRVDAWRNTSAFQTTAWLPLPDALTVLAAGTAPVEPSTRPGYLWFLTVGGPWGARRVEACAGVPVAFTSFAEIDRAYLACRGETATLVVIDTKLERVIEASSDGLRGCEPADLAISRTGGILFVPCRNSGTLLYLDRVTLQPLDSIRIEPGISLLAASSRGPQAVVLQPDRSEAVVLDLQNRSVRERIGTGGAPLDIALSGDGRWAFIVTDVADAGGPALLKVDLRNGEVARTRRVPAGTLTVAVWPGTKSPVMNWR